MARGNFITNWAINASGEEDYKLEVVTDILKHLTEVVDLWENNDAYQSAYSDILRYKAMHFNGNINGFLELYKNIDKDVKYVMDNGYDSSIAYLACLQNYAGKVGITLNGINALRSFASNVREYLSLEDIKRKTQIAIIKENASKIYYDAEFIRIIKLKNGSIRSLIGTPDNVSQILGENGSYIIQENHNALAYVINLEDEKYAFEGKKSSLEADKMLRESNNKRWK